MLEKIIIAQVEAHPSAMPADLIKLCFQAAWGAEHLLLDRERAQSYFLREYEATEATNEPLLEEISAVYSRMNIGAVKRLSIEPDRAFEAFFLTASEKSASGDIFDGLLASVGALAEGGELPFSKKDWDLTLKEYCAAGGGPVHHSEEYRQAEHPAYRVIAKKYAKLLKENDDE